MVEKKNGAKSSYNRKLCKKCPVKTKCLKEELTTCILAGGVYQRCPKCGKIVECLEDDGNPISAPLAACSRACSKRKSKYVPKPTTLLKKLRFEKGSLWYNHSKHRIYGRVSDVDNVYKNNKIDFSTYNASFSCQRCGGYYFWANAITVRYGIRGYERNCYCLNCFEKRYPLWKRLVNLLPLFRRIVLHKEHAYIYIRKAPYRKLAEELCYPKRELPDGERCLNWHTVPLNLESEYYEEEK